MTLPPFLKPAPLRPLPAHDLTAHRDLTSRWLLDLAFILDWPNPKNAYTLERLISNDEFFALIGLPQPRISEGNDGERWPLKRYGAPSARQHKTFVRSLKTRRAALAAVPLDLPGPLLGNLRWLAALLGLSEAEQAVICFVALLDINREFYEAINHMNQATTTPRLARVLARLTHLPETDLQAALHREGVLSATGLIVIGKETTDLERKLELRHDLSAILHLCHETPETLMAHFLKRSSPGRLNLAQFPHLERHTETVLELLRSALTQRIPGTNVLLYGPPGVGKTEYAIALAKALGVTCYEVNYADEVGNPIRGEKRLRAYNLCQRLLARQDKALLLFDEVEDVFERHPLQGLFGDDGGMTAGKAWINRSLENNPVPSLWITNAVDAIHPAYRRRFDDSIRFSLPPRSVRLDMVRHHLGVWSDDDERLNPLADREGLTPAQLERAAKLARHAGHQDPERNWALIVDALDRSATLLGQKLTPVQPPVSPGYDLRFVNTDQAIPKLITALQHRPQGVFCFHGPSGTGKSALARYLAEVLDKSLLVKRASDLLSPYLGETEQQLAALFTEARQREAVLVLDEVDSFLQDRRYAHHNWERSQVNELLTQLEAFEGLFIATTNRLETLDPASLRRFTWKIRFAALTPNQRWGLFLQEFARLGGELTDALDWQAAVRGLRGLTPGDVAVVVRQYMLWDETPGAGEFYHRLHGEVMIRGTVENPPTNPRSVTSVYG